MANGIPTQNYNLNTWLSTDRFILSELNKNFTDIDTQMKINEQVGKNLTTQYNALSEKVGTINKTIETIQSSIQSIQTSVQSTQSQLSEVKSQMGSGMLRYLELDGTTGSYSSTASSWFIGCPFDQIPAQWKYLILTSVGRRYRSDRDRYMSGVYPTFGFGTPVYDSSGNNPDYTAAQVVLMYRDERNNYQYFSNTSYSATPSGDLYLEKITKANVDYFGYGYSGNGTMVLDRDQSPNKFYFIL